MGNYYCKKCSVPSTYYKKSSNYDRHSCRFHKYNKKNKCLHCGLNKINGGNCRHIYKKYFF